MAKQQSSQQGAYPPLCPLLVLQVSPAKSGGPKHNYLEQVSDLHSLLECGALTEAEFEEQKAPILEQLKKMKPM